MKKSKNALLKTGKYLREISVIVLGVAITLSVSQWLNNRGQKQDIAIYLSMIKTELETSIRNLEEAKTENFMLQIQYVNYLLSHDVNSRSADSIASYQNAWGNANMFVTSSNVFELFKNSGVMHLIDDKELLLSLWNVDFRLRAVDVMFNLYFQEKWNELRQELPSIRAGRDVRIYPPLYDFYINTPFSLPHAVIRTIEIYLDVAREALAKLENVR